MCPSISSTIHHPTIITPSPSPRVKNWACCNPATNNATHTVYHFRISTPVDRNTCTNRSFSLSTLASSSYLVFELLLKAKKHKVLLPGLVTLFLSIFDDHNSMKPSQVADLAYLLHEDGRPRVTTDIIDAHRGDRALWGESCCSLVSLYQV
jgi:hypothetical protein